ncbi:Hypothetical predicted protein [Olea europaea subsp. europaea]|nr:Hypothetical predicted protein [Olea europaea subsp. europaea]
MLQEFPQLSRPLHAYGTNVESSSTPQEYGFSNQYFDAFHDFEEQENEKGYKNDDDDDLLLMLRGFVDELDEKGHGIFNKLFTKFEKDVPFERLSRETLEDFRGRPVSGMFAKFLSKLNSDPVNDTSSRDRGLEGNSTELKQKLERFKIKTINVGGIVKEEQK